MSTSTSTDGGDIFTPSSSTLKTSNVRGVVDLITGNVFRNMVSPAIKMCDSFFQFAPLPGTPLSMQEVEASAGFGYAVWVVPLASTEPLAVTAGAPVYVVRVYINSDEEMLRRRASASSTRRGQFKDPSLPKHIPEDARDVFKNAVFSIMVNLPVKSYNIACDVLGDSLVFDCPLNPGELVSHKELFAAASLMNKTDAGVTSYTITAHYPEDIDFNYGHESVEASSGSGSGSSSITTAVAAAAAAATSSSKLTTTTTTASSSEKIACLMVRFVVPLRISRKRSRT